MALTNRNLEPGTVLAARYKGTEHRCEVVAGDEGKLRYRLLASGEEFTSPSAAGSAVMGGAACNGWRFWSLEGELAEAKPKAEKPKAEGKAKRGAKAKAAAPKTKPARKAKASENGSGRIACGECGEMFPHARAAAEHMRETHGAPEAQAGEKS